MDIIYRLNIIDLIFLCYNDTVVIKKNVCKKNRKRRRRMSIFLNLKKIKIATISRTYFPAAWLRIF